MEQKDFTVQLSNCLLTKKQVDQEHHYFVGDDYYVSITQILGIGAPQPEGLLQWFKDKTPEEIEDRMIMTRDRGTKLHHALDGLAMGQLLYLEDYPTSYEKAALVTFIRFMRFLVKYGSLNLKYLKSEYIAADTKLKVAGTIDLCARADIRALELLCNPTYTLKLVDDDYELVKPLNGPKHMVRFLVDNKFTGRSTYNHKVQVTKYKQMHNMSYKKSPVSKAYIWRFSPKHKFSFDFEDASIHLKHNIDYKSFNRIYDTTLEFIGGYPKAPTIDVYPETISLWKKKD